MKTLHWILLAVAMAGVCLPLPATAQPAPLTAAADAICKPLFRIDGRPLAAGTAFLLQPEAPGQPPVLVTALHLFGPDGGLPRAVPPEALPRRVALDRCQTLSRPGMWGGGRALSIPGAAPGGTGLPLRDIAAFAVDIVSVQRIQPLRLASSPPAVGEPVWLVASVIRGAPTRQLLHRAHVVHSSDDQLQYSYDNPALELRATSGAPVVNARGEVVGVNLGGGVRQGETFGIADSLTTIRAAVAAMR